MNFAAHLLLLSLSLCKDSVVDMTPSIDESQIDLIGGNHTRAFMEQHLIVFGDENNNDIMSCFVKPERREREKEPDRN